MFYCEPCRIKHKWPKSLLFSRGRCEVCETSALCYDRPSSGLSSDDRNVTVSDDIGIRVMKDGTTVVGNLAPDAPKDQRVTIPAEQMKQFARVRAALNDDDMITGSLNASHMTFGNVVRIDLATGAIERLPGFTTTDEAALAFWDAVERLKGKR